MIYGYARVSTKDQSLDLQIDALKKANCVSVFSEVVSGALNARPEWNKLVEELQEGDTLIVWKLDRMGRSLKHLIKVVNEFDKKGVNIKSLNEPIDTTSAHGRLMLNMFASLAEFEKDLIRERTIAGLKAARSRGRLGGRKPGISEEAKSTACLAEALYKQKELKINEITKKLNISVATFYKYLRIRNVSIGAKYEPRIDQ